jgi:HAD superfamily hydrolase (TIGR01509 family)
VLSTALHIARGNLLRRFDLVIFDCDGVIIDSEMISARILIGQLARAGVSIDFDHVREHYFGRSFPKVSADIRKTFGVDLPGEFELQYRAALLEAFETELRPMPGISGVMAELGVQSCVATSSSPPRAKRSLELSGLERWFGERVFTASQVANGKPAPDLFLFAARTLGVDPARCLVIEDSLPGVDAALAAGMTVWRFTGGSHMRAAPGAGLHGCDTITIFDNWADFFEMAPDLRKAQAAK